MTFKTIATTTVKELIILGKWDILIKLRNEQGIPVRTRSLSDRVTLSADEILNLGLKLTFPLTN